MTGGDGGNEAWKQLNMAGYNIEDESDGNHNDNKGEGDEGKGDDGLVDTEERWVNTDKKMYKDRKSVV